MVLDFRFLFAYNSRRLASPLRPFWRTYGTERSTSPRIRYGNGQYAQDARARPHRKIFLEAARQVRNDGLAGEPPGGRAGVGVLHHQPGFAGHGAKWRADYSAAGSQNHKRAAR